ncbi:MAG TPA: YncE family protein [bacterium]
MKKRLQSIVLIPLTVILIYVCCSRNNPPVAPEMPAGVDSGAINVPFDFSSWTIDPDNDDIAIRFSWGDGSFSEWSDFLPSGSTVTFTHSFADTGIFLIKALAKDGADTSNYWSNPHPVKIGITHDYPYRVVAIIPVGNNPYGIVVLPDNYYAYVTNSGDNSVSVLSTWDHTVMGTFPSGDNPGNIAALPNDRYVYIAGNNAVMVMRTSDNAIVDTIPVPGASCLAPLPNGEFIYVVCYSNIAVIRTSDNTVVKVIDNIEGMDFGITVLPNGNYAYVTNDFFETVEVIQCSEDTIIKTIEVGKVPWGIAALPNSEYVYAADLSGLTVIRTSDNTIVDTISAYGFHSSVAALPDGKYVYTTNYWSNSVLVIRTSDNAIVDTITVGEWPVNIAVMPNGKYVFVANEYDNTVSVIGN